MVLIYYITMQDDVKHAKDINLLQFHINELIITDWGEMDVKGNRTGKVF